MDSHGPLDDRMFRIKDSNGLSDCWILLRERLATLGYAIHTADNNSLDGCEYVIFLNSSSVDEKYNTKERSKINWRNKIKANIKKTVFNNGIKKRNLYQECLDHGLSDKIFLFMWEGKNIEPGNYNQELHEKFPLILTWDDNLADGEKFKKFYLPRPNYKQLEKMISFEDKKMLVMINADRISSVPGELNSERRKAAKFFSQKLSYQFDLYGSKWNNPKNRLQSAFPFLVDKIPNFRGHAADKMGTLSKYRFSISYENLSHEKGYITEKIFDSFAARIVPIYWGAENIDDYIAPETFIDRRNFKDNSELLSFITEIKEKEYNQYLEAIEEYLKSEKYKLFSGENFVDTVINNLNLKK